ncbi:MAG: hypothetical protein SGPRY_008910 [Prymnesium sp.]
MAELSSSLQLLLSGAALPQPRWARAHALVHSLCSSPSPSPPHQLYSSLRSLLSSHALGVARRLSVLSAGVELLRGYARAWAEYEAALASLSHLLASLNRTWATVHSRDGIAPLPGVYDSSALGLVVWRVGLVEPLEKRLVHAMLDLLDAGRIGKGLSSEERGLLRSSVDSWRKLGIASKLTAKPPPVREFRRRQSSVCGNCLELGDGDGLSSDGEGEGEGGEYAEGEWAHSVARNSLYARFEVALLERSKRFYAARAQAMLCSCAGALPPPLDGGEGVLGYLEYVQEALRVEAECASVLPDAHTREAVRSSLEQGLLQAYQPRIEMWIEQLLLADNEQVLRRLYRELCTLHAVPLLEAALHRRAPSTLRLFTLPFFLSFISPHVPLLSTSPILLFFHSPIIYLLAFYPSSLLLSCASLLPLLPASCAAPCANKGTRCKRETLTHPGQKAFRSRLRYIVAIADDTLDAVRQSASRGLPSLASFTSSSSDEDASTTSPARVAKRGTALVELYVAAALTILDKLHFIVDEILAGDPGCQAVLERAFRSFLNSANESTAEQLALYCSSHLMIGTNPGARAGEKAEREEKLSRALHLLEFLDDQAICHRGW